MTIKYTTGLGDIAHALGIATPKTLEPVMRHVLGDLPAVPAYDVPERTRTQFTREQVEELLQALREARCEGARGERIPCPWDDGLAAYDAKQRAHGEAP